ncbi:MAG TPA: phage/plasmid primase, P4 family [Pirellulales bacterium]|jgi:putative DNA primase/helicase|nr:phage/plasmid primase, P4 family [Pirellulales bacterium]
MSISPDRFDIDHFKINVENGTIDLRSGKLLPHNRADFITKLSPVKYDPDAKCPLWDRTIASIFNNNRDTIGFFQRFSGYCLSGSVVEQIMVVAWGGGSNGKGIITNTYFGIWGDYATKAPETLLISKNFNSHPCELAKLQGVRLCIANETSDGAELAEARIKDLTGSDRLTARGMKENFWDFWPTHKFILSTNFKPRVKGGHSIWRRIRLLAFLRR